MKLKKLLIPFAAVGLAATLVSCDTDEINANKTKIAENQANIEKANTSIAELKAKLEAADTELAKSITKQVADLKLELLAADSEAQAAFDAAMEELDTELTASIDALETLAETLATKAQVADLKSAVDEVDNAIKDRITAIETVLKGDGTELKSRFVTIEGKINSLEAVVETLATKEELENQVNALDARLDELEADPTTKAYLDSEIKKLSDMIGDKNDMATYDPNLNFVEGTIFGRIRFMEDRWARFNSNEIINLKVKAIYNLTKLYTDFDRTIAEFRAQAAYALAKVTAYNYKGKDTQTPADDIYDSDEIKALLDEVFTKVAGQWSHDMQVYFEEGKAKLYLIEQAPYIVTDTDRYASDEAIEAFENGDTQEIEYYAEGTEITEIERIYEVYRDLLMSFNDEAKFIIYKELIKASVSELEYLSSDHSGYTGEAMVSDIDSSDGVIEVIGTGKNTESFDYIVSRVLDVNYELEITSETTRAERDDYLDSLIDELHKWLLIGSTLNSSYKYEEESKKMIEAISSVDGATAGKYLTSNEDGYKDLLFAIIDDEIDPATYLNAEVTPTSSEALTEVYSADLELIDLVVRRGYGYNAGMSYAAQMKTNVKALLNITPNEKTILGDRFDLDFDDYLELDADNAPEYEFNDKHNAVIVATETDGLRLKLDKAIIDLYLEQAIEYNRICGYTKNAVSGTEGINTDTYKNLTDNIKRGNVTKTAKEWFVELIESVPDIDNYTIDFELGVDDSTTTEVDETETFADATLRAVELKDTVADIQYKDDENEVVLYREEAIKYNNVTKVAKEYEAEIADHFFGLSTEAIATSSIYTDLGSGYNQFSEMIENVRDFDNYYKEFAYKAVEQGETPETHTEAFKRMLEELTQQYGEAGATEYTGDKDDKSGDLEAMALLLYETKAYYQMMKFVFDSGVQIYDIYNHNKHTALKDETDLVYSIMVGQYKDNDNDLYVEALLDCEAVEDDSTTDTNESKTTRQVVDELMDDSRDYIFSLYTRVYVYNELYNYVRLDYYGVKVTENTFTTDGSLYKREGEGTDSQPYNFTPITSGTYSSTALYFAKSPFINNIIRNLTNMSGDDQDAFIDQYDHETDGYIASFDTIAENVTSVEEWAEIFSNGKDFIDLTVYNAVNFDKACEYAKASHVQNTDSTASGYLKYLTDAEITEFNGYIDACLKINDFLDDVVNVVDDVEVYDSDTTLETEKAAIDLVVFRATMLNEAWAYAEEKFLVFESKGTEITEETFNAGTYFVKSGLTYVLATEWVSGTEYFQVKNYSSLRLQDVSDTNNRIISFVVKSEYLDAAGTTTITDEDAITAIYDADVAAIDLTLKLVNEFNKARAYAKDQRDAIDALTKLTTEEKNADKDKVDGILDAEDYQEDELTKSRHINAYIKAKDLATAQGILTDDKALMDLRYTHAYTVNALRIKTESADSKLAADCYLIDTIYTAEDLGELYGENSDQSPSRLDTIKEKIHAYDDFTVEKKSIAEYNSYYAKGEEEIGVYTHFAVTEHNILNNISTYISEILAKTISQTNIEALEATDQEGAKKELFRRLLNIYKEGSLISYNNGIATFNAKTKGEANNRKSEVDNMILNQIDPYL
ncbi:MAG: hypothetical protein IKP77_04480 [Acholeplasmatales bacterium]|nr:hypothetical protein [Acholeplasmatales bacterium]